MLTKHEEKEMLSDAASTERRKSFRKTRITNSDYSLDSYLKFLDSVHKSFVQITPATAKSITPKFIL